jgi:hypothetical protein
LQEELDFPEKKRETQSVSPPNVLMMSSIVTLTIATSQYKVLPY